MAFPLWRVLSPPENLVPLYPLSCRLSHAYEKNKRRPEDEEERGGRELGLDCRSSPCSFLSQNWLVLFFSSCFALNSIIPLAVHDIDDACGVDRDGGRCSGGNLHMEEGEGRLIVTDPCGTRCLG